MPKKPLIIEQKKADKNNKPLRYIHNIEALRRKIGCASYDELKALGYDVDGYYARKEEERLYELDNATVPTGWEDGVYWGT